MLTGLRDHALAAEGGGDRAPGRDGDVGEVDGAAPHLPHGDDGVREPRDEMRGGEDGPHAIAGEDDVRLGIDLGGRAGYRYSSSVYPVQHDHYGMPDAPRFPYRVRDGLLEIPVTTTRLFGRNLPAGGGGYFRLAPYNVSRWAIARVNRQEQRPAIFYFHPWELDPEQPRMKGVGVKTRFRHYLNLHRTRARLTRLLTDFEWDRVDRVFDVGSS